MSALDAQAIEAYGIPPAALMERAGTAVAEVVQRLGRRTRPTGALRVHILCGKGNNGGDGLVAARALANWGARVRVYIVGGRKGLREGAATFLRSVEAMHVPVIDVVDEAEVRKLGLVLRTADVLVDAILGVGAQGPLRPLVARVTAAMNEAERPVVAVDVPTGVDASTGQVAQEAVRAAVTVTFGLPKVGHLVDPGRRYTGQLEVAEIGFPRPLLSDDAPGCRVWVRAEEAARMLRVRPVDAHKGSFGRVVVVAGSLGMAGAAVLAVRGALRSGAGLVAWAGPRELLPIVQSAAPEATAMPLPGPGDVFSVEGAEYILERLRPGDAVAVGPGLGRSPSAGAGVLALLAGATVPVVVDADGLNAMAAKPQEARRALDRARERILTPHAKEAARLLGEGSRDVAANRLEALKRLVEAWGGTVLLKGNPTLIAQEGGRTAFNGAGDVTLATGGTGDVLTGVCAGLLAQGYPPWEAAALGAYLHGLAGEIAGKRLSQYAATAADVADALPAAFARLCRVLASSADRLD